MAQRFQKNNKKKNLSVGKKGAREKQKYTIKESPKKTIN